MTPAIFCPRCLSIFRKFIFGRIHFGKSHHIVSSLLPAFTFNGETRHLTPALAPASRRRGRKLRALLIVFHDSNFVLKNLPSSAVKAVSHFSGPVGVHKFRHTYHRNRTVDITA